MRTLKPYGRRKSNIHWSCPGDDDLGCDSYGCDPPEFRYNYNYSCINVGNAAVTIIDDDDWIISAAVVDGIAIEPMPGTTANEVDRGSFEIKRTLDNGDLSYGIDVVFRIDGSAKCEEDYYLVTESGSRIGTYRCHHDDGVAEGSSVSRGGIPKTRLS